MPRRSIDKKDQRSSVQRFELGDFERQQLEKIAIGNIAGNLALPIGIGIAGAAVGFGLFLAGKELEELQDWIVDKWNDPTGTREEDLSRLQNDIDNNPVYSDRPNTLTMPPVLQGLSIYSAYETTWDAWDQVFLDQYQRWINSHNLTANHDTLVWFRTHGRGILNRSDIYRVDNSVEPDRPISQFTYQLAIRETAHRRRAGIQVGLLSFLGGPFTGLGYALTWGGLSALGFSNPTEWTTSSVEDAPGYIPDPLLDIAWHRHFHHSGEGQIWTESDTFVETQILEGVDFVGDAVNLWPATLQ